MIPPFFWQQKIHINLILPVLNILQELCSVPFFRFRKRAHGGCDRSSEDAHYSLVPDSIFFRGPCLLCLCFVFFLWILVLNTVCYNHFSFLVIEIPNAKWFNILTQSSLYRDVLEASTRDFHLTRYAAIRGAVSMVRPLLPGLLGHFFSSSLLAGLYSF